MGSEQPIDTELWHLDTLRAQALASDLRSRGIVSLCKTIPITEFVASVTIDRVSGQVTPESPTQSPCGELVILFVRKDDYVEAKEVLDRFLGTEVWSNS